MQFSTLLTLFLATVTLAIPAPGPIPQGDSAGEAAGDMLPPNTIRPAPVRGQVCYRECVDSQMCLAAYPQDCYCRNNVRSKCAKQCAVPLPTLEKCPPIVSASVGAECIGGSYGSCIGAYLCTAQYPQGCHCMNGVKTRCAAACKAPKPQLEKCDPITPVPVAHEDTTEPVTACKCAKPVACVMSWPGSCHCEVDQRKKCAELCGNEWDDEKERAHCKDGLEVAGEK
ncbi:hypothetical protein EX30DRAFT_341227 [Ascodesmis nigricans]|uniref:Extracellular membrane protein CFEM domain-containing protein n=1 Tax=Ascodesmis nigricans TaxID=341454 RepID=A0A4S2MW77_9PEZI|nr:hypothetical protein EX30DRAFT_341227 [Ascodesmis nigricans]